MTIDLTDPLIRWHEKQIGAYSHALGCPSQGEPCLECECGLPNQPAWAEPEQVRVHRIFDDEESA